MNILQKAAEILVECGYAFKYVEPYLWCMCEDGIERYEKPIMFSDTLEGRRQADAIETWFYDNPEHCKLWNNVEGETERINSSHNWRIAIIKQCLQELIK